MPPISPVSHLQFPLSQRRKRRVLFTQAQVNAFCTPHPIPDTLHRISTWYLAPGIFYLIYQIPDTRYLMSENQIPLDICYLIWTQPTFAAQLIMCGGWVKSIYLSSELEPFSSYLVLIAGLEVKFKNSRGMKVWHFAGQAKMSHFCICAKLTTFSSRFPAEDEKESFSLRHR